MNNFFIGVVEDIQDPLRIGRVKLRVKGIHSESKVQTPTEDLPWAAPMHPITSAADKGVGYGGVGMLVGTQTVCFFRDPGKFQEPVVIGTLPGLQESDIGSSSEIRTGQESDLGMYATNNYVQREDSIVTKKNKTKIVVSGSVVTREETEIRSSSTDSETQRVSFTEPDTPYNAMYGKIATFGTTSGHLIEIDDTTDGERIHIWHKSGSFVEMHPNGDVVLRKEGNVFDITHGVANVYVDADKQEYVGGGLVMHVQGDINLNTDGSVNAHVGGDCSLRVDGDINSSVGGDYVIDVEGEYKLTATRIDLN